MEWPLRRPIRFSRPDVATPIRHCRAVRRAEESAVAMAHAFVCNLIYEIKNFKMSVRPSIALATRRIPDLKGIKRDFANGYHTVRLAHSSSRSFLRRESDQSHSATVTIQSAAGTNRN